MRKYAIVYNFLIGASVLLISSCSKKDTVTPDPVPPVRGNVIRDVVYGSNTDWLGNTVTLLLDVYQPANMEEGKQYPLALFMHGGGYVTGDKGSSDTRCSILADSGFIVASLNYRLGWDNPPGTCEGDSASLNAAGYRGIQDVNAALRYLVSKFDLLSIDTNWIFVGGASAGATMALNSTYLTEAIVQQKYPDAAALLGGLNNAGNNLKNAYSIKGIYSIAGALPDSNLITAETAVPTIFFQGDADEVIPVDTGTYLWCDNYPKLYGSLCLYRRLQAVNKPAVAHILPGSGHGNNGNSGYDSPFIMSNTACFFHNIMRKELPQTGIFMGEINSCR